MIRGCNKQRCFSLTPNSLAVCVGTNKILGKTLLIVECITPWLVRIPSNQWEVVILTVASYYRNPCAGRVGLRAILFNLRRYCNCSLTSSSPLDFVSDGFSKTEVDYKWKKNKVTVAEPTMAQFSITSSKVSRRADMFLTGTVFADI